MAKVESRLLVPDPECLVADRSLVLSWTCRHPWRSSRSAEARPADARHEYPLCLALPRLAGVGGLAYGEAPVPGARDSCIHRHGCFPDAAGLSCSGASLPDVPGHPGPGVILLHDRFLLSCSSDGFGLGRNLHSVNSAGAAYGTGGCVAWHHALSVALDVPDLHLETLAERSLEGLFGCMRVSKISSDRGACASSERPVFLPHASPAGRPCRGHGGIRPAFPAQVGAPSRGCRQCLGRYPEELPEPGWRRLHPARQGGSLLAEADAGLLPLDLPGGF